MLLIGLRPISPWPAVFARGAEPPGPPRCWVAGSPRCWLAGGERPGPHAAAARRSSADFAVARSICPGGRAPRTPALLGGRISPLLAGRRGASRSPCCCCWLAGSLRCWLAAPTLLVGRASTLLGGVGGSLWGLGGVGGDGGWLRRG